MESPLARRAEAFEGQANVRPEDSEEHSGRMSWIPRGILGLNVTEE